MIAGSGGWPDELDGLCLGFNALALLLLDMEMRWRPMVLPLRSSNCLVSPPMASEQLR